MKERKQEKLKRESLKEMLWNNENFYDIIYDSFVVSSGKKSGKI